MHIDRPMINNILGNLSSGAPNSVSLTTEVTDLLARNCVVAVGVSGGKDSDACAVAVSHYLDEIHHQGPRILIHADLGRVEWKDSLPSCERLAARIGWELVVVQRKTGDMLARWQGRWANNIARYQDLSCVKLILPWSTPSMRFCTSELKVDVITSALKKRYPGQDIINVAGVRRQESTSRSKMPVSAPLAKLQRKGNAGISWNAIIEWPIEDVFFAIREAGLSLHEAHTKFGASRVSCAFCIMSSIHDLTAAAGCTDNHQLYMEMVTLEAQSTFAFQGNRWLADTAPHLLPDTLKARVAQAKIHAERRRKIEAMIPKHLLFTSGVPTSLPTIWEAKLLAAGRREISEMLQLECAYLTPDDILSRYESLLATPDLLYSEN